MTVLDSIRLKFFSGTSIPVSAARITAEEWAYVEAALAREVVSVEAIEELVDLYWPVDQLPNARKLLPQVIHALQLVPMSRDRLVEIIRGATVPEILGHTHAVRIADAIREVNDEDDTSKGA